jgi:O-methyltransferase
MQETDSRCVALYLELIKSCLTRLLFMNDAPGRDEEALAKERGIREFGWDWPDEAETMIGMVRLNCIQECVESVLRDEVPGDLLEAGVWRGGAVILMRAVLKAHGALDRTVWAADSFRGLPPPDASSFTQDLAVDLSGFDELAVSVEQVKSNFSRYGLLDDQVAFLEGWFKDTLPDAPIERLAVLRLDGDYYESTIQVLESLYHKVSPGGFVIVDDYLHFDACKQAVDDFRAAFSVRDEIVEVDWNSVYWRVGG